MSIKEMEEGQRPREKALTYGLAALSDQEVLMLVVGSGTKTCPLEQICLDVIRITEDLNRLFDITPAQLMEVPGIRQAKALQILAAVEICRRARRRQAYGREIESPEDVAEWVSIEYGAESQEHFIAIFLDARRRILSHKVIAVGTVDSVTPHPRDVFREACLANARTVILVHNHPSGSVQPSRMDRKATRDFQEIGALMGIPLSDHIIVSRDDHFSFARTGLLFTDEC